MKATLHPISNGKTPTCEIFFSNVHAQKNLRSIHVKAICLMGASIFRGRIVYLTWMLGCPKRRSSTCCSPLSPMLLWVSYISPHVNDKHRYFVVQMRCLRYFVALLKITVIAAVFSAGINCGGQLFEHLVHHCRSVCSDVCYSV